MIYYYLMAFTSVVGLALQFSITKLYQKKMGAKLKTSLFFTFLTGAIASFIFFGINGFQASITPFSLLMAGIISLLCCTYTLLSFKIVELGKMSVYTLFLMLGGMMLPYLFGIIFLDENPSIPCIIGLLILIVALIIPAFEKENEHAPKNPKLFFLLCSIVFVLNGFVSIFSKLHQIEEIQTTVSPANFVMLSNIFSFIFSGIVLLILFLKDRNKKTEQAQKVSQTSIKSNLLFIVCVVIANSAISGGSYMLQLIGAANLPASVMYPLLTGGSIILLALAGRLFFKEKITKYNAIGLLLAFVATFLFLF